MKLLGVLILATFVGIVMPSSGLNSRKLEDGGLTPGVEKKCSGCSCNSSQCAQVPPPPPPPKSAPPSTNYHPPPSDDSGGSSNYPNAPPPPPSQQYVYMPAPPGNDLYTVSPTYIKNVACKQFATSGVPAFVGSLLLGFLAFS